MEIMSNDDRLREARTLCNVAKYVALGFLAIFLAFCALMIIIGLIEGDGDGVVLGIAYAFLAILQFIVFAVCNSTVRYIEKGDLKKAKGRCLASGILGILFNIISGILALVAYSKIKSLVESKEVQSKQQSITLLPQRHVIEEVCPNCGAKLRGEEKYCPYCGYRLKG